MIGNFLAQVGAYVLMLRRMLYPPENWKMFCKRILSSCYFVGIQSLGLILMISFFMGLIAVTMCIYIVNNPIVPHFVIGMVTRETLILELTPTGVTALIACVVGFRITFEIGSLKRNEQIDALETMGVNSASFIVFPFVIGALLMIPILMVISLFTSLFAGWCLSHFLDVITPTEYLMGIQFQTTDVSIKMFFIKIFTFSFIIASVAAFMGYNFRGTVQQLSRRSTYSITINCILLLVVDYAITSLVLYT